MCSVTVNYRIIVSFVLLHFVQTLLLSLEERDAEEIILVLRGYHKLATDRVLPVHRERSRWTQDSGIVLFCHCPDDCHKFSGYVD